jgi:hypothetical protein
MPTFYRFPHQPMIFYRHHDYRNDTDDIIADSHHGTQYPHPMLSTPSEADEN